MFVKSAIDSNMALSKNNSQDSISVSVVCPFGVQMPWRRMFRMIAGNARGWIFHLVWSQPLQNKRGCCWEGMSGCWGTSGAWNSSFSSLKSESKLVSDSKSFSIFFISYLLWMTSSSSADIWTGRFLAIVKNGIVLFEKQWKLKSLHTIVLFLPKKIEIGKFCHANYWAKPNATKRNSSLKLYHLQLYIF